MADFSIDLAIQTFSTSFEMLSQQKTAKLADYCYMEDANGREAFAIRSQVGQFARMKDVTTSAQPIPNTEQTHDRRWVYPLKKGDGTRVDNFDLGLTNISPQGMYTQSAVAAVNREKDHMFLDAYFGTAQTGKSGSTATAFDSDNVVAATVGGGGAATGMNRDKIDELIRLAESNEVDLDMETLYVAITPQQKDDLFKQTIVTSADFVGSGQSTSKDLPALRGVKFVVSNLLPADTDTYRRCPAWVASGMACGIWQAPRVTMRNIPNEVDNPMHLEWLFRLGFTRLEEAKCFEIKCAE
jgi:hypothetical protein